jgi:hypothetical protein
MKVLRDGWRKNAPELAALWNGALPAFVTARNPRGRLSGVPVFSYHTVAAESFEADLTFLQRNGYRSLSSAEFLEFLAGNNAVPERSVLLTFDDGPENFHSVTYPLLLRFGVRAIAFVAPGLHAEREEIAVKFRPMSWQEIKEIHASGLVDFQSHTLESRYARWLAASPPSRMRVAVSRHCRSLMIWHFRSELSQAGCLVSA